jgi:Uncharacterised nucleotidyltransferase
VGVVPPAWRRDSTRAVSVLIPLMSTHPADDRSDAPAELLARTLRGDLSWETSASWDLRELLSAAADHGVEGLTWRAFGAAVSQRGLEVREELHDRARSAAARDLFIQRDMRAVLDVLIAAHVPALVIKGSALAYSVYERPWLRPRTDTDLLIRFDDFEAASRQLEACGYVRSVALTSGTLVSHQVAFERVDDHDVRHVIDLHWKVANPQVLAEALTFEDLWRDRRPAPALGPSARVPSVVGSAVLSCIHRLAHHQGHERLIWLYDLRLLTRRFGAAEWDELRRLSCDRGVAGLCLDGLLRARDLLGADLSSAVETALRLAAPGEASHHYLEGTVRRRDVLTSDLEALPSWRDRLRLLREHAFPPAAFIRQRYGVKNTWLLPALYVHRIVTGAYKWVRP